MIKFYFSRPHKLFRRTVFAGWWSWLDGITAPFCCPGFGKKRCGRTVGELGVGWVLAAGNRGSLHS